MSNAAKLRYVLRLADTSLVLAQQLSQWVGHAPALEEDLGLANIALDLVGQARLLLSYAGELEGRGRSEDDLAYLREQSEYYNVSLAEQPNGDFADTIVRQLLLDAYRLVVYGALERSSDQRLADIAAKSVKEIRYHIRYSGGWLRRLGDGTEESHERAQLALDRIWRYTTELFATDDIDEAVAADAVAPRLSELQTEWNRVVNEALSQATLMRPPDVPHSWHGKRGEHTEHLGYVLAEMQSLHRAHPGATW